jgi:Domain of unknown function (DUF4326)
MIPARIQLSRAKGWRLADVAPGAVVIRRPTKWGNPWSPLRDGPDGRRPLDMQGAVGMFEDMLADPQQRAAVGYPMDLSPLRGKTLACTCALDQPCHGDVLLGWANA